FSVWFIRHFIIIRFLRSIISTIIRLSRCFLITWFSRIGRSYRDDRWFFWSFIVIRFLRRIITTIIWFFWSFIIIRLLRRIVTTIIWFAWCFIITWFSRICWINRCHWWFLDNFRLVVVVDYFLLYIGYILTSYFPALFINCCIIAKVFCCSFIRIVFVS